MSAGGGTDSANRMIMAEIEKHLPVSINVTNQTGGLAGWNGLVLAMNKLDDGYTLVCISASNVTAVVQGGWDQKFDFWYPFVISGSPDLISVLADSPFNTRQELVDAPKAKPGAILAAASEACSIGDVVFPKRQSRSHRAAGPRVKFAVAELSNENCDIFH